MTGSTTSTANNGYEFTARTMTTGQTTSLNVAAKDVEGGGWGAAVQLIDGVLMIRQNKSSRPTQPNPTGPGHPSVSEMSEGI